MGRLTNVAPAQLDTVYGQPHVAAEKSAEWPMEDVRPQDACALARAKAAPTCSFSMEPCCSDLVSTETEFDISSQDSSSRQLTPKAVDSVFVGSACPAAAVCESSRLRCSEAVVAEAVRARTEDPEDEDHRVPSARTRVKNTFVECYAPNQAWRRRSHSLPKARCEIEAEEAFENRLEEESKEEQTEPMLKCHCEGAPLSERTPDATCYEVQGFCIPPEAHSMMPQWPVYFYPVAYPAVEPVVEPVQVVQHCKVQHCEVAEPTVQVPPVEPQQELVVEAPAAEMVKQSSNGRQSKSDRGSVFENKRRMGGEHRRGAPEVDMRKAQEVISAARRAYSEGRRSQVWPMCRKDPASSALVQKAIEAVGGQLKKAEAENSTHAWQDASYEAEALLADLQPHVLTAIEHPHANYVLQKVLECLPAEQAGFIAWHLYGKGWWATSHRFGCRVMLRIASSLCDADKWVGETARSLLEEVLPYAADLVSHQYGNYVIQEVLVNGIPEHRHKVARSLLSTVLKAATHQHGSRVVESALMYCNEEDSSALAAALLKSNDSVRTLMCSEYGCFVLKALLKSPPHSAAAFDRLRPMVPEMQKLWFSRRLVPLITGDSNASA